MTPMSRTRTLRTQTHPAVSVLTIIAMLAALTVVMTPTVAAQPVCQVGEICEAEAGRLRGNPEIHDEHPGHTGSGYVAAMIPPDMGVEFDVDIEQSGAYVVLVRYASAQSAIGKDFRTLTLTSGDHDELVRLPVTAAWNDWSVVGVPLELASGVQTLDVHVGGPDNDGHVNIDHFRVLPVPEGSAQGDEEQGVTMRVFDVGIALGQICELREGQTPNVDVLRETINWMTPDDFGGYSHNYLVQTVAFLDVDEAGEYGFRLASDDGSRLSINGEVVVDHDGLHGSEVMDGTVELSAGRHELEVDFFQAGGGATLALLWQPPGADDFEVVPNWVLATEGGGARVVSPGTKYCADVADGPGDNAPLNHVHPSFDLVDLRPDGFEPDVSGMSWFADGSLAVLTWGAAQSSSDGALFRVENVQGDDVDLDEVVVTEIANGMEEPQGVHILDDDIYVSVKSGIDILVDDDGDGFYEGRDRLVSWPYGENFHEFGFGLPYHDGYFYVALSVALERSGSTTIPQLVPDRGNLLKIDATTGAYETIAGGLRTPNGIWVDDDGEIFVTDNQGDWLPASKLIQITEGAFYNLFTEYDDPDTGERVQGRYDDQPVTPPTVWMPHNEISNSPSTPVVMEEGLFAGQMAIGDVTYGGLQRVFLEDVEGHRQGAVYRMSQGLEAGINEVAIGPDGDIYLGGIGYDGNWGQPGKLRHGLQKLTANDRVTMDILETRITETGFDLTYTKPLAEHLEDDLASRYQASQWTYNPTSNYGGPKIGEESLPVTDARLSPDRLTVSLDIDGVRPDRVVHIRSPRPFEADDGEELWSTEVWYTASVVPGYEGPADLGFYEAEEAALGGNAGIANEHNGYSGSGFVDGFGNQGASLTFNVHVDDAGTHPINVRYANGPHPFAGTKTVSLIVNGDNLGPWGLPSTGTWQDWGYATRDVALEQGTNTVRFEVGPDDDGSVNFDLLTVGAQLDVCAPTAPLDGYTSMFDGTLASFTDWQLAGPGSFSRTPDCTLQAHGGMGLLWHDIELERYRFRTDFRPATAAANSGVFVGFPEPGNDPWVAVDHGYEIQIDDVGAGSPVGQDINRTGAIYSFQAPSSFPAVNGAWNTLEIEVDDPWIRVWVNDELVNEFEDPDGSGRDLSFGHVGLQNHPSSGGLVQFRNVQYVDLDELPQETVELELEASTRCVVGNAFVAVTARNDNAWPVDIEFESAFGSRTFVGVAADRYASHAFHTRSSNVDAGSVTVRGRAIVDGVEVTVEQAVDFEASSC